MLFVSPTLLLAFLGFPFVNNIADLDALAILYPSCRTYIPLYCRHLRWTFVVNINNRLEYYSQLVRMWIT